jgi:hypothetical protein
MCRFICYRVYLVYFKMSKTSYIYIWMEGVCLKSIKKGFCSLNDSSLELNEFLNENTTVQSGWGWNDSFGPCASSGTQSASDFTLIHPWPRPIPARPLSSISTSSASFATFYRRSVEPVATAMPARMLLLLVSSNSRW